MIFCNSNLVWWASSNTYFHILNNLTHISTHFFIHTYIKNIQTILFKLFYQMGVNVSLWERVESLYHHLIPFQTNPDWIDFELVWIIYEIAGNYISDYRIQVEFHSSQPMNFLSNTDPPSIPDFFFFKSKKQNQEKTMEKIKLHVNVSHAYVAEVWTCSL